MIVLGFSIFGPAIEMTWGVILLAIGYLAAFALFAAVMFGAMILMIWVVVCVASTIAQAWADSYWRAITGGGRK